YELLVCPHLANCRLGNRRSGCPESPECGLRCLHCGQEHSTVNHFQNGKCDPTRRRSKRVSCLCWQHLLSGPVHNAIARPYDGLPRRDKGRIGRKLPVGDYYECRRVHLQVHVISRPKICRHFSSGFFSFRIRTILHIKVSHR
ncbi:hypothetical protein PENTCL1PPCAC_29041, partial [Pristionchus entomophagus]